jgi:hypothetical protein
VTQTPQHTYVSLPARVRLVADVTAHLLEAVAIPLGVFYGVVVAFGLNAALLAALGWAYLAVAVRLVRRSRPPMLLLAATAMSTVKVAITFAADSATAYFLQPTVITGLFALALLCTWGWERPLIQRLAHDFCPLPDPVLAAAPVRRFFQRLSVLWGAVLLVNTGATLALLLTMSTTWSVPLATAASIPAFAVGVFVSYKWFLRSLTDAHCSLRWG